MHNLPLACMNEIMGNFIGKSIGMVQECDVGEDEIEWGKVLKSPYRDSIY